MKVKAIVTLLFLLLICNLPKALFAQETGIQFEKASDWPEVLKKAQVEHKFIFVDCYATWCGPCKQMDVGIYPLKEVGDVYNQQFIAVKLQMDRTANYDADIKSGYYTYLSNSFATLYNITAYPTFLFFDPDHHIVHKATGSFNVKGFLQLAKDAQNPNKQYYKLVKNFSPGKLDTAEEKSLATTFRYTDKELGQKIALDYLTRIPPGQITSPTNEKLIILYHDDPQVLSFVINYFKSLSKATFEQNAYQDLLGQLREQPPVMEIAVDYIEKLDQDNFGKSANLRFVRIFKKAPKVHELAQRYINHLTEEQIYTEDNITTIAALTTSVNERGFDIFYRHGAKVDSILGKGTAQDLAKDVIKETEFTPLFSAAKETGVTPDFNTLLKSLAKKYDNLFAELVSIDARLDWYKYLIYTKKESQYWPGLNEARIAEVTKIGSENVAPQPLNSIAYSEFFDHCDNQAQLEVVIGWMKDVEQKNPDNVNIVDTYACLLYKTGKLLEALAWEQKVIQILLNTHGPKTVIDSFMGKIEKMKQGNKIWLEKEYQ